MLTIVHNGHTIKIQASNGFTTVETVWYDGREVSRHNSLAGSHHDFLVEEEGQSAHYEVSLSVGISVISYVKVTLQRNGELLFSLD